MPFKSHISTLTYLWIGLGYWWKSLCDTIKVQEFSWQADGNCVKRTKVAVYCLKARFRTSCRFYNWKVAFSNQRVGQKGQTGSVLAIWKHWTLPAGVTICSVTERDITSVWRDGPGQNDIHGTTVVAQRSSWKSNVFDADSILKKKQVVTFYRKIRNLTMVIRYKDDEQEDVSHRRTGNFLPRRAVNHLPKRISQVAQIFTKKSERKEGRITTT